MKHPLWFGLVLLGLLGCAHRSSTESSTVQTLQVGSFEQVWTVTPDLNAPIDEVYVSGDHLFVYSKNKQIMVMSPTGSIQAYVDARGHDGVRPPEAQADRFVIPCAGSVEVYSYAGVHQRTIRTEFPFSSAAVSKGDMLFGGMASEQGGRFGALWLNKAVASTYWTVLVGEVTTRPAIHDGIIYMATLGGHVIAFADNKYVYWPKAPEMPDQIFKTDGRIECEIRVDEGGVYVPSTDSKMYALDPVTGRIRWEYFAGRSLNRSVTATADTVYLPVGSDVVALPKKGQDRYRKPLWTATSIEYVVADDARYVYALNRSGELVALEKATGKTKFVSSRSDIVSVHKSPEKELTLIVRTKSGQVIAVRPVTVAGKAGVMVQADLPELSPAL